MKTAITLISTKTQIKYRLTVDSWQLINNFIKIWNKAASVKHSIFPNKSRLSGFWLCEPTLSSGCPSTSTETGQLRCEVIAVSLAPPVNKLLTAARPFVVPPSWDRSPTGAGDLRLVTDFSWIIEFCYGKTDITLKNKNNSMWCWWFFT